MFENRLSAEIVGRAIHRIDPSWNLNPTPEMRAAYEITTGYVTATCQLDNVDDEKYRAAIDKVYVRDVLPSLAAALARGEHIDEAGIKKTVAHGIEAAIGREAIIRLTYEPEHKTLIWCGITASGKTRTRLEYDPNYAPLYAWSDKEKERNDMAVLSRDRFLYLTEGNQDSSHRMISYTLEKLNEQIENGKYRGYPTVCMELAHIPDTRSGGIMEIALKQNGKLHMNVFSIPLAEAIQRAGTRPTSAASPKSDVDRHVPEIEIQRIHHKIGKEFGEFILRYAGNRQVEWRIYDNSEIGISPQLVAWNLTWRDPPAAHFYDPVAAVAFLRGEEKPKAGIDCIATLAEKQTVSFGLFNRKSPTRMGEPVDDLTDVFSVSPGMIGTDRPYTSESKLLEQFKENKVYAALVTEVERRHDIKQAGLSIKQAIAQVVNAMGNFPPHRDKGSELQR